MKSSKSIFVSNRIEIVFAIILLYIGKIESVPFFIFPMISQLAGSKAYFSSIVGCSTYTYLCRAGRSGNIAAPFAFSFRSAAFKARASRRRSSDPLSSSSKASPSPIVPSSAFPANAPILNPRSSKDGKKPPRLLSKAVAAGRKSSSEKKSEASSTDLKISSLKTPTSSPASSPQPRAENALSKRVNREIDKEKVVQEKKEREKERAKLRLKERAMARAAEKAAELEKNRPFTLPSGLFRPKQSLGQNFLSDQNYVTKIVEALVDHSAEGSRVVELGPGPGALSRSLFTKYPKMTAIEIDQRAIAFLSEKLPGLEIIHMDVLQCDWPKMAFEKGGRLSIIGNLPYYITSQILFSLADSYRAVLQAVVTMQHEVAERITAKPRTKSYGILSVVFQLYGTPRINFKIPPSVFYPKPNVDSALVTIDFTRPHPSLHTVKGDDLRKVVSAAFRQRRKMLRQSLKRLIDAHSLTLPKKYSMKRPEELTPSEFVSLTGEMFGFVGKDVSSESYARSISATANSSPPAADGAGALDFYRSDKVWRSFLDFGYGEKSGPIAEGEEDVDDDLE